MLRRTAPLSLLGLLLLSGCCGGYAVVRTTVADHAQLKDQSEIIRSPQSAVLHYSRLGEPANSCGSDVKYLENLWVQVPSLAPGQAFTIGAPGVVTAYTRQQGEETIHASGIAGRVEIKGQTSDAVTVALAVTIMLPSGETVKLDDDYDFHPAAGEKAPAEAAAAEKVWSSCRTAL